MDYINPSGKWPFPATPAPQRPGHHLEAAGALVDEWESEFCPIISALVDHHLNAADWLMEGC